MGTGSFHFLTHSTIMVKIQGGEIGHDIKRSVRQGSRSSRKTRTQTSHRGHSDAGSMRDDVWSAKSVRYQPVGTRPRPNDVAVVGIQSGPDAERGDASQSVQQIGQRGV